MTPLTSLVVVEPDQPNQNLGQMEDGDNARDRANDQGAGSGGEWGEGGGGMRDTRCFPIVIRNIFLHLSSAKKEV